MGYLALMVDSVAEVKLMSAVKRRFPIWVIHALLVKPYCRVFAQAKRRRSKHGDQFIFPYDLGCWRNFTQVSSEKPCMHYQEELQTVESRSKYIPEIITPLY